jgi:hypothetical protein
VSSNTVCKLILDDDKVKEFDGAIKSHYWYEMFLDDLPVWGFVGEIKKDSGSESALIYTHKKFDISFNNNRVRPAHLLGWSQPRAAAIQTLRTTLTHSTNHNLHVTSNQPHCD